MESNPTPLLSVCLITYNHVNYIKQAIEGVLMQKVDFSWDFIIADDFSSDGTREIILDYYTKHPDFIKPLLQDKKKGAAKNWMDLISTPRAKYIAYLEGDDYWTDPLKLQKQVDFLEQEPEYVLCFHKVGALVNDKLQEEDVLEKRYQEIINKNKITTLDLLKHKNFVHSSSVVFRNKPINFPFEFDYSPVGDYFFFILLSESGFLFRIDEYMGIYRRGSGSYSTLLPLDMQKKVVQYHISILSYLSDNEQKKIFLQDTLKSFYNFESIITNLVHEQKKGQKILVLKNQIKILMYKLRKKISQWSN